MQSLDSTIWHIREAHEEELAVIAAFEEHSSWDAQALNAQRQHTFAKILLMERTSDHSIGAYLLVWFVQDELHVLNIVTHVPFRRMGLARALLLHAFQMTFQSIKLQTAYLEVREKNVAARCLYEQLGFYEYHRRFDYYPNGETAVEMRKALP